MAVEPGYNFDVSNLDSDFYQKYSAGTPVAVPFQTVEINDTAANIQVQNILNSFNDRFIDDSVKIVLKFTGTSGGSLIDSRVEPLYHRFISPVYIDHPVADRLVIEGEAPSDHSILGVSYYDAYNHTSLVNSGEGFTGSDTAAANGFFAQLVVSNGNSLKMGEYLAIYDNRYQKYRNPSFFRFRDEINGRVFATPYPVTAEKLRASLIIGVHRIVDKIDLDERNNITDSNITQNPVNKVDYVTVHIKNHNPTYTIGLKEYPRPLSLRGFLTPQGIVGRYEQGYGSSTVLQDPLFFTGLSSGTAGADAASIPGYRYSQDYAFGVEITEGGRFNTRFLEERLAAIGASPITPNRQGLSTQYLDSGSVVNLAAEWESYERIAQDTGLNLSVRNNRDSNDFRAKGYKTIIVCDGDGFVIANCTKPPELKNLLLLSNGSTGHGIRVDNSSSVTLHQVAVVGFTGGAGIFANNKSTVNIIADKFADPEVFREVGAFSCYNYTGFEARNHSNINAHRTVGAGNLFANYYAAENSYINAYAATSTCSTKYGIVAVGKSFINADASFSCFNGKDGYFCSNGSLLTINAGRACYNYGNGIHAFSSGEIRAFDVIASSNKKDGIVANDSSTIVCGDSSKEPVEWDLYYGYESPYYNFESPTNISQSRFNGISGLASSTDSFINASFFEAYDNSRQAGELGKLRDVACVYNPSVGYCYGATLAGTTCDATYLYCDDTTYDGDLDTTLDGWLDNKTPLVVGSICVPYSNATGFTGQIPVSKSRYSAILAAIDAGGFDPSSDGETFAKILICKGYIGGCGLYNETIAFGVTGTCSPDQTVDQILSGSPSALDTHLYVDTDALACTADSQELLFNTVCINETNYSDPARPLNFSLPNYDVEIRDSSKIVFAGRIANFGYYDVRTGVRIQPFYPGSGSVSSLFKPATLIGYSGNKNGSELVIVDQTTLETGILGDQGAIDPRDSRKNIRYSSDDYLVAAELYDPVPQVGYVNPPSYILNLGNKDPDTGAALSTLGATAAEILETNTANTPQDTTGTNDATSGTGYPTY